MLNPHFKKYEKHGDDCLVYNIDKLPNTDIPSLKSLSWAPILKSLKFPENRIKRIFIRSKITDDGVRTPQVEQIYGDETPGSSIVTHKDNGITYKFDLNLNMFSRGNIQEKIRMSKIDHKMTSFADLYSGIGYFSLQIMKENVDLVKVSLFEWNPNAVKFNKINVELNFRKKNPGIIERTKFYPGDNRMTVIDPENCDLEHNHNRIMMGLIPCSCGSLKSAAYLSRLPCLIHVHHNIDQSIETIDLARLPELYSEDCVVTSSKNYPEQIGEKLAEFRGCNFEVQHVQKVKSYGPKVNHMVIDVLLF